MSDHLIRKGSIYYYRRRIPADLVAIAKKSEYCRSLRTADKREAERRQRIVDVEIDEKIQNLRIQLQQPEDTRASEFSTYLKPQNGLISSNPETMPVRMTPQYNPALGTWEQHPADTTPQYDVLAGKWVAVRVPSQAEWDAAELAMQEGAEEQFRHSERDDAEQEAWSVKQEQKAVKRAQFLSDLDGAVLKVLQSISHQSATPPAKAHPTQPATLPKRATDASTRRALTPTGGQSLHAIMRLWASEQKPVARTVVDAERAITRFRDLMGDVEVPTVTKTMIVEFRNKLREAAHSDKTINKTLNYMSIMFNHAISHAWIDLDPAKGTRITIKEDAAAVKRVPFSEAVLNGLFAHPIYTEGLRPELGAGEAAYWLPLLALFTGARIEELCQLAPIDIQQERYRDGKGEEQAAWVMHITNTGENQRVKTRGSKRRIPIHAEIIDRGFIAYVDSQKSQKRIFPLLKPNKYGDESPNWSVWWMKQMRRAGTITGRDMVFHSFRHNYKDACRDCGINKQVADALQGHSEGDASGDYGGEFYPLRPMVEAVAKYRVAGVKIP